MSGGVNGVEWTAPLPSTGNGNIIQHPSTPCSQLRFPNRSYNSDWIRTIDAFEVVDVLGEGTFGQVLKGRDRATNELVALKKIKEESGTDGFPISALREINILKKLRDIKKTDNVVVLKEITTSRESSNQEDKGNIFLVFEYMDHDLSGLMEMHYDLIFKQEVIKCYLQQLLRGVYDLHHNRILHRDIKASNLLVNNKGILKIADFGLARPLCTNVAAYTANVVTLWYRPPELLMCDEKSKRVKYTTHVDIWSVGCVFAEMLFRKSLFRGRDRLELLDRIFSILGTPTHETAPELLSREDWQDFKPKIIHSPQLQRMCTEQNFSPHTYELLSGLLAYDPSKRLQAAEALDSDYFWQEPLPCLPSDIPACTASHEYTVKKRKERLKPNKYTDQHHGAGTSHLQPYSLHKYPVHPNPQHGQQKQVQNAYVPYKTNSTQPPHLPRHNNYQGSSHTSANSAHNYSGNRSHIQPREGIGPSHRIHPSEHMPYRSYSMVAPTNQCGGGGQDAATTYSSSGGGKKHPSHPIDGRYLSGGSVPPQNVGEGYSMTNYTVGAPPESDLYMPTQSNPYKRLKVDNANNETKPEDTLPQNDVTNGMAL